VHRTNDTGRRPLTAQVATLSGTALATDHRMQVDARVGCSGWDYAHWKARFHAAEVPRRRWLEGYAEAFDTVELNNSFYRLPAPETFAGWAARVPPGFVFAVKASRFLTHIKRLKDPHEPIHRLLEHAQHLGAHLGPLLYQLPPRWMPDLHRLTTFVTALPRYTPGEDGPRVGPLEHVIEFRHETGVTEDVLALLHAHGVGVCLHDMPGGPQGGAARAVTSNTIYVRFHGATAKYAGRYHDRVLDEWADFLRPHLDAGRRVYAYFNNDIDAQAPTDARRLRDRLAAHPPARL
jgi:uncharacterized protein YecE (DUF72 family)